MHRFIHPHCFLLLLALFIILPSPVLSEEIAVSNFAVQGIKGWESKEFKGHTSYQPVQEQGRTVIKASAKAAASGLFKKLRLDPKNTATSPGHGRLQELLRVETKRQRPAMTMPPGST